MKSKHKKKEVAEPARVGDWIATYAGAKFFPFDPKVEEVNFTDIGHALSNLCRFGGHCSAFYSVAQHSVLVSMMSPPDVALWSLVHDSSEAYLADIPSPLKKLPEFEPYRRAEKRVMEVICDALNLPHEEPKIVKLIDKRILATEARDLTFTAGFGWSMNAEPYDFHIKPWTPDHARVRFMSTLDKLMRAR